MGGALGPFLVLHPRIFVCRLALLTSEDYAACGRGSSARFRARQIREISVSTMPSLLDAGEDESSGDGGTVDAGARPPCQYVHRFLFPIRESIANITFDPDFATNDQHHLMSTDTASNHVASLQLPSQNVDASYQPNCAACGGPILDRYLLKVCDSLWHEHCLTCSICDTLLAQAPSCYVRDGKIFCKLDYKRIFGAKCARCLAPLNSSDIVQRTADCVYHAHCFTCLFCGQLLQPGDQFVINDGQLVCRSDYESVMQNPFGAGFNIPGRLSDHRKAPKRPRTILTSQQRKAFKASFEISAKPCRKVRETLAKETGLSVRVVQVWFQNQRAKMKKLQRKQEQNQKHSSGDGEKRNGDKDGESSSSKGGSRKRGPDSPGSSSIDSSDDDLDVSSSPGIIDASDKSADQPQSANDINPIHKLYSMQESYFNF